MTRRLTIALLCLGTAAAVLLGAPAGAQQDRPSVVDVVEVNGLVDAVVADFIVRSTEAAERHGAHALVIQLDSGGEVVGPGRIEDVTRRLRATPVPVAVWVGPTGSRARQGAAALVEAADLAGRAPDAVVRPLRRSDLFVAPTLGDFIVELDGREAKGRRLETSKVVTGGDTPRRQPTVQVRFGKLPGMARLLHTAASPSVAYLLLLVGLVLAVFELYTAGIGIAAAVAAGCLVLAGYGLEALPTRGWAVAALVVGVLGFTVDLQAGAPRTWTAIGSVLLAAGTVRLYDGVSPSLVAAAVGVGGVALAMVAGMPAMVRSRFSTPTIGREAMIGEVGAALSAVAPDGTVELAGAPWRARTNRATPLAEGDPVRVVAIDGLVLEVEPLEGAAKDHRRR